MTVPSHRHRKIAGIELNDEGTVTEGSLISYNATNRTWSLRALLTAIAHAVTSAAHTASNWSMFYSNGSGVVTELALGANQAALISNGTAAAPSFGTTPFVLSRITTSVHVVNTIDTTYVVNVTAPAGITWTDRRVRVTLEGDFLYNNNVADTLQIDGLFNGSLQVSTTAPPASALSTTRRAFTLVFEVQIISGASGQTASMMFFVSDATAAGFGRGQFLDGTVANKASRLTTHPRSGVSVGATPITWITMQWSAASVNNDIIVQSGIIEVL